MFLARIDNPVYSAYQLTMQKSSSSMEIWANFFKKLHVFHGESPI
jgi:hypothetical protein